MRDQGRGLRTGLPPQAIFLDRDGTINRERADYVKCWPEYEWLPGALAALALLAQLDIPILIVTNQSAVGRGILSMSALAAMHERVRAEAAAAGGRIDQFLVCPHAPDEQCACRKPQPGLLQQAAAEYGFDLARCVLIGDSITDLGAGEAAGCNTILVRTGRQGQALDDMVAALTGQAALTPIVDDLAAAVRLLTAARVSLNLSEASFE
jgi:D-glycero-D-manno-heptose 1,7-bisphosphate phosphatase